MMAELLHFPSDAEPGPTRFPQHRMNGAALRLQQIDAQAAVDAARLANFAARRALIAASASVTVDDMAPARLAADEATSVLRAAVHLLTALAGQHGLDAAPAIVIDVHQDGATIVVRPHGELDLVTSPQVEAASVAHLDGDAPPMRLLIDLAAVTFLDSSALAVLVEIQRACHAGGTSFALTGPTRRTRRLLEITRLDGVLPVV